MTTTPDPVPTPTTAVPEPKKPFPTKIVLGSALALGLLAGSFFIGKATTEPEIRFQTVEKEVIKTEVPQACHSALVAYESYGKNLESMVYSYKEFISNLEGEFNGVSTPQSTYEALGMNIGLNRELADEQTNIIGAEVVECNKYL